MELVIQVKRLRANSTFIVMDIVNYMRIMITLFILELCGGLIKRICFGLNALNIVRICHALIIKLMQLHMSIILIKHIYLSFLKHPSGHLLTLKTITTTTVLFHPPVIRIWQFHPSSFQLWTNLKTFGNMDLMMRKIVLLM